MALLPVGGFNQATTIGTTGVSWRKLDIYDKIMNLDPTDTPVIDLIGEVPCRSRQHDWQTRVYRARAVNAMFEGADYTFSTLSIPSRVTNQCQILEDGIEVSRSLAKESMYGAADIMRDQIDLNAVEHRNDMEFNLINSTYLTGATASAGKMRGLRASITTNVTNALGVTLSEQLFVDVLANVWQVSGVRPDVVLTGIFGQNKINTFNAQGATKWINTEDKRITNEVMIYNSSFCTVQIQLCRDLTSVFNFTSGVELLFFNKAWNHKAIFERTFVEVMPKIADAERAVMITELTFQHDNEKSSAKWQGVA